MHAKTRIGVVGAGQMGAGIAQVAATAGMEVTVTDIETARIDTGKGAVTKSLSRLVKKEKMTGDESSAAQKLIRWSTDIESLAECAIIVEAVTENTALKQSIFRQLNSVCNQHTILASNTSSISITELAAVVDSPERVVGMHFMNPVPVIPLLEVIRGAATSDSTCQTVVELAQRMGKTVTQAEDYPGFLSNRLLMPMINEAFFVLQEQIGTAEDIDNTMTLGMGHPLGPLALADLIGLDTCLAIMEILHTQLGESKYRPSPLLRRYVAAGWFGRKTGRGVYQYEE